MNTLVNAPPGSLGNVVDLDSRRPRRDGRSRILRVAPENDGLRVLYSNDAHKRVVSLDIIAWALHDGGEITALVPWLRGVTPAPLLADPLNGQWEGYWDPARDRMLQQPPPHKAAELHASLDYFGMSAANHAIVVQSMPDAAGTHAVLSPDGFRTVRLIEVIAWQLRGDGAVLGMLADGDHITDTPVLPTDECLYAAQEHPAFRYFFQHAIANQIKRHDPEALACLAMLAGGESN